MKILKITPILVIFLSVLLSCSAGSKNPIPIESNFPLKQILTFPSNETIERIAVSETWMTIQTSDKLTALDINTQKTLWNIDFSSNLNPASEFLIVNDIAIAASNEQIILVNQSGQKKELNLEPKEGGITRLTAIYPNYVYVVRGSQWNLEAYDISRNALLWTTSAGKGETYVFYDESKNIAYVTTRDESIRALDNLTGKVLWKYDGSSLHSAFEAGILYMVEHTEDDNIFRFSAFDVESQKVLWKKDINHYDQVSKLTIIGDLLIASGRGGLLALNKSSGDQVWHTDLGETIYSRPVEFDGVIYAKSGSLTVYAISPDDGSVIGYVQLENEKFIPYAYEAKGEVIQLKDGIAFNTRDAVVIYKAK